VCRARSRRGSYYCLKSMDNITMTEGRNPALFMQPTSGGWRDCYVANHPKSNQDTTEEAVCQGQARRCLLLGTQLSASARYSNCASKHKAEHCACLGMKSIGKPCAGKSHARFDEGGQAGACSLLYQIKLMSMGYRSVFRRMDSLKHN
jgi:hypothetical protein